MDDRISALERATQSDPSNINLFSRLVLEKARVDENNAYSECIKDINNWARLNESAIDTIVHPFAEFLGPHFGFHSRKKYAINGKDFFTAKFEHSTGMIFSLIPGNGSMSPFLIADFPTTERQSAIMFKTARIRSSRYGLRDLPCTGVSWEKILKMLAPFNLELPSPNQWLHALGLFGSNHYWGNDISLIFNYCWVDKSTRNTRNKHLGKENCFGLIDMIGNVWEYSKARNPDRRAYAYGGCYDSQISDWSEAAPEFEVPGGPTRETVGFRPIFNFDLTKGFEIHRNPFFEIIDVERGKMNQVVSFGKAHSVGVSFRAAGIQKKTEIKLFGRFKTLGSRKFGRFKELSIQHVNGIPQNGTYKINWYAKNDIPQHLDQYELQIRFKGGQSKWMKC